MGAFRDIWNLVVTGDTSDVDRKLGALGRTAESTGATADTSIRGRFGGALSHVAEKIPGVSGLMDKFGVSSEQAGALMGTAVAGGAAAAGLAVEHFVKTSVEEFQNQAQEVLHFRDVSGLAADEASRFVAVADDFGVSGEDLATAIGKMDKAAGTTQHLQALGIEIGHTKDGGYDAQQTFLNVVDAFNNTDDASRKAAIGAGAFGKGWQSMSLLLEQGSGKIKESFGAVKDFQLFSDADLQKSENYRHAMDDLGDAVKGLERRIGEDLVPVLTEAANKLRDMAEGANGIHLPFATGKDAASIFGVALTDLTQGPGQGMIETAKYIKSSWDDIWDTLSGNKSDRAKQAVLDHATGIGFEGEQTLIAAQNAKTLEDAIVKQGAAFNEFASNAMAGHTQGWKDAQKAIEDAKGALDNYRQGINDLVNDQLGFEGAMNGARDAIDELTKKTNDHTTSKNDLRDANLNARESFVRLGDAAVIAAQHQAEQIGATLTANGAIDVQVDTFAKLATTLDPSNPLRVWLSGFIQDLQNIPGHIETSVELVQSQGPNATTGKAIVSNIKAYEAGAGSGWRSGPQ